MRRCGSGSASLVLIPKKAASNRRLGGCLFARARLRRNRSNIFPRCRFLVVRRIWNRPPSWGSPKILEYFLTGEATRHANNGNAFQTTYSLSYQTYSAHLLGFLFRTSSRPLFCLCVLDCGLVRRRASPPAFGSDNEPGDDGRILKHLCNRKRDVEPCFNSPCNPADHRSSFRESKKLSSIYILSTPSLLPDQWFVPSPFGRRIGTRED